jgi:glycosyltransferase involved in cell wall biosynthesis
MPDTRGEFVGHDPKLRIAIEAPPWFEIPPQAYGGIEWICSYLADGLTERGHEVTVIGAGRPLTAASFVGWSYERPPSERLGESLPEVLHAAVCVRAIGGLDVDVVHTHMLAGPLLAAGRTVPTVATAHGPMTGELGQYFRWLAPYLRLVSISASQRAEAPHLPWVGTVYNGIPVSEYPFRERKEDFLLFLGRMSPEKGVHIAIDAARKADLPIMVAGKCNEAAERDYFAREIAPRLGRGVEWIGPVGSQDKMDLLARARCLVNPIQWSEPFGIVMVEAAACGTPVVAIGNGSVPEVVDDGRTGVVVCDPAELAEAIRWSRQIDPAECRARAERMFDTATMVAGNEQIYRRVAADRPGSSMALVPGPLPVEAPVAGVASAGPDGPQGREGALQGGLVVS